MAQKSITRFVPNGVVYRVVKIIFLYSKMIPKEEAYIPPMNIKIIDHRHFGRKPVVGVHTIRSLLKYKVDRNKQESNFFAYQGEIFFPSYQRYELKTQKVFLLIKISFIE